ncbi:MAG: RHS repeat domain-containing protein [Opitutaceae bacterium]
MKKKLLGHLAFIIFCFGGLLPLCAVNDPSCCDDDSCEDPCDCSDYAEDNPCECDTSGDGGGGAEAGSIEFGIGFPSFSDNMQVQTGTLRFHHEEPSLTMFTPQGIDYLSPAGSYLSNVSGDFSEDESVTLTVVNHRGQGRAYKVPNGSSIGQAVDSTVRTIYEIEMLDANRNAVVDVDPTYVRLSNLKKGSSILIDFETGDAVEQVDKMGRVTLFDDLRVIREDGVVVQIAYAGGLVDFEVIDADFEYEIRFYAEGDYSYNESLGVYELNVGVDAVADVTKRFNVANPAYDSQDIDEAVITRYWDGRVTQWQFQYYANNDLWELRIGEILNESFTLLRREEAQLVKSQDGATRKDIKRVYNGEGSLLSEVIKVSERIDDSFRLVNEVRDPTSANLITQYGYYSEGDSIGERKYKIAPDGYWEAYAYDSEGRQSLKVESWLDITYNDSLSISALADLAKATEYSYTPVDARDDGSFQSDAPRVETTRILGNVTSLIWNAYLEQNDGSYHEITERAVSLTSQYGSSSNLREEQVYYATVNGGGNQVSARRLQSRRFENGAITTFDYSMDVGGDFVVTKTHTHTDASSAVAFKSIQRQNTYNSVANLVREEMFVFDGSGYQSVYYVTRGYDDDRNHVETRRFDGIVGGRVTYSASYNHGKATLVTDESGRSVSTMYDILGRKEISTVSGSVAAGVGAITQSYGYSTSATGCGCSAAETQTMDETGTLTMTEINETDRVKRPSRRVDVNGLETAYEYTDGGRVTTVTNPNLSTRITTNYLDGRIKSITGTGVVPEYYSYGVNLDGSTWTRVDTATANSPRYRKMTYDLVGRVRTEESPAYDASTFTTEYAYDGYGRLASQSRPGQADTLYNYDSMGELNLSGLDINDNGTLDLASADRITGTDRSYMLDSGAWFDVSSTTVYPELNSASSVTVSSNKRRLSGFTGNLTSESQSVDVHNNTTIQTTEIDRTNKTVTQTVDTPGSTIDAISVTINGYLKSQNSSTVSASTTYGYDGLGRRTSMRDPRHAESTTIDYYTGTRQVFTQTDGANNTTSYIYFDNGVVGAGQVKSVKNALLKKNYMSYDLLGRQIQTWGQTDYPQSYSYNTYGELKTLTTYRDTIIDFSTDTWPNPTGGDITTWSYQPSTGLLTRKEYADTKGTDYSYTSANQLYVRTWARNGGLDTTYSYDPDTGELLNVNYEAADTADITYTYDRLGRQDTVADATGTRSFDYDLATLQLDTETLDSTFYQGHILARSYEDGTETNGHSGRSSGYSLKDSGGTTSVSSATYGYETTGRLQTVSSGTDSFTYGYEPNSNLLASLTAPQHSVTYDYEDNRNVMTEIDNKLSGATTSLSKYTYTYDDLGRRDDRTQSGSAISVTNTDDFIYNDRSEVTGSTNSIETAATWNPTYTFDQIGNRKSSTGFQPVASYTSNGVNQYTAIDAQSPTYDFDGNLETDGGTWSYTWNNENRLVNAANSTTSTSIDFVYDYQGRLAKKVDGTNIEVYVYDGWNRIATHTVDSSFVILNSSFNLWGLDLSGSMQGAGGVGGLLKEGDLYPTYDANGNIMQKLDGVGVTAMNVGYDPFGNIISGTLVGEYGFSTKPLVNGLDWYYYGFRYYDPGTGRWPNRDPIGEQGGLNLYGMVNNEVTNLFDYLGLAKDCCGNVEVPTYKCCADSTTSTIGMKTARYRCERIGLNECIDNFCNDEVIDLALDQYETPGANENVATGGFTISIIFQSTWGTIVGVVTATPTIADQITRRLARSLCRIAARSACEKKVCCDWWTSAF